ncbi:PD-(D/E)XK nuclease family protein [Hydrogenimonas sp.]
MKLHVLTTARALREAQAQASDGVGSAHIGIGEFFDKAIVVPHKAAVQRELRAVLLHEALEGIDAQKLGISRDFVRFFAQKSWIFDFFTELAKERVAIEELILEDTYDEYGEHLRLLSALREGYLRRLEALGLYDASMVEDFVVNDAFFGRFESVELEVAGYLSRFEREILEAIPCEVTLRFWVTRYNRPLIEKMLGSSEWEEGAYRYDFKARQVLERTPLPPMGRVEVSDFSERIWQVPYAMASLQEFVAEGFEPERFAVILPDESYAVTLRLFNDGNLNFAMGRPFSESKLFITLQAIYDCETKGEERACRKAGEALEHYRNSSDLAAFIRDIAILEELAVIDEELHRLGRLYDYVADPLKRLHLTLERLRELAFDDTEGGKVTVMGVLESRANRFDGVVILDFNDGIVPRSDANDLFLSSAVRQRAGLPSRKEKEALQKHYYAMLLRSARRVHIAYVHSEEANPSRFLYELGLPEGDGSAQARYGQALFRFGDDPVRYDYEGIDFPRPKTLYPSSLEVLRSCTLRYYFQYILKLDNEEEEEFNFGSHFHETLEELLKKRPRFESAKAYYEALMDALMQRMPLPVRYDIATTWSERIEWFCREDFPHLGRVKEVEAWGEKPLEGYLLKAKADRIDEEAAIDYKTGSPKEADELQALFYRYIFGLTPRYYYIKKKDVEEKETSEAQKELTEIIKGLRFTTQKSDDPAACKYCPYTFICGR